MIRTGGLVGFLLLSLAAVGILGAVVLLPEYTRLKNDEYRVQCEAATVKDLESLVKTNERFFAAVKGGDPVETSRLAMSICSYVPTNETVIPIRSRLPSTPGVVKINPAPRPPKPDDMLIRYSARVENPATRRGLCLIAGGLMLAAMFLYATPGRRRQTAPA